MYFAVSNEYRMIQEEQTTLWIMHIIQVFWYKEAERTPVSQTIALVPWKSISSFTCYWNIHNHHIPPSSLL